MFLLEVDSLQKLGHNFFGIMVTCTKCSASSSYYYMPRKFVQLGMMVGIIEKKFRRYQRNIDGLVL